MVNFFFKKFLLKGPDEILSYFMLGLYMTIVIDQRLTNYKAFFFIYISQILEEYVIA
jgi:hypothetical protein